MDESFDRPMIRRNRAWSPTRCVGLMRLRVVPRQGTSNSSVPPVVSFRPSRT